MYEITLPVDMLWQEVDSDDYYADATEEGFVSQLYDNLHKAGFEAQINWSTVVTTQIEFINEEGDSISHDDFDIIKSIIDRTEVIYLEVE